MRRKVAGNLLWLLADRGLQVVVGIGVVAMLARALGTEGFAHFQYAQSLVFIAASIPLICSAEVVVPRLVARPDPGATHALLTHAFTIRLTAGIAGYVLMNAYLAFTQQPADTWIPAAILGTAIMLREPFGVVIAWMQARTHNRPNVVFNLVAMAAKVALIGALFFTGVNLVPAYATAFAIEPLIAAALLAWYYLSRAPRTVPTADAALTRDLVRDGTLFWVSFMLMVCARRADQLILKPLVPLAELGAYAATMQVLDNFTTIATILAAGVAPMYVFGQQAVGAARRNVLRVTGGMIAVGLCGAIILALCAEWVVQLLYGQAFGETVVLLRLAALASTLIFADVGLSLFPVYLRKPRWVAVKWALVLVTTVVVDFIAVPSLGTRGAVLGYAMGNAVALVFGLALVLRVRAETAVATA
ncbi:lipopolysaccharide biosynthesis protein [Cupriavidus taiwanensis]|uniref:Lipopolysaccharide biosynthesis protein n=1 Tax=Cupriavidus taiwanensis TaxID=164546 RepID=A0A7Z7J9A8_9BURK|nr:oligosaccharide flippase family protein [Cupriavidus taiwanensis]SOY88827.1 Lipopolysaccharide biosynthesis protein [Cupriavidus taiwanensis]SOZ02950.1 Lipopolysaccharide biosynthesis protein [Cupriavidus taiwanensis]SOZ06226.1 Lipopolysaccharide biosynthesis protein [Cupriavidus taiwanensis]SPC18756.1 Lipopolysaccharide biosynthesis protein [Cupriavidus taiwanensis]SPD41106.1 Lipopolysaccharide biosynthesis protein [Cupriavidus taiwanensis]